MLFPIGNKPGQVNFEIIKKIKNVNRDKLTLLHLLTSIDLREKSLYVYTYNKINSQESIFNCSNIKVCRDNLLKINKMNIDDREKNNLYDRAQIKIKEIITRNLQKFIKYLKDGNYKEGKIFLINYFSQIYINPNLY